MHIFKFVDDLLLYYNDQESDNTQYFLKEHLGCDVSAQIRPSDLLRHFVSNLKFSFFHLLINKATIIFLQQKIKINVNN